MCGASPCKTCETQGCSNSKRVASIVTQIQQTKPYASLPTLQRDFLLRMTGMGSTNSSSMKVYYPWDMGTFIREEDKLAACLALNVYGKRPQDIMNLSYYPLLSNDRIGVWTGCNSAYVAFRGTQIIGKGGINDLVDDLLLASEDTCDLGLAFLGSTIIVQLFGMGYGEIILSGHSLGGRAALCLGNYVGVTKVVALNAGAPVISPTEAGPGPAKAIHYHIFGDIVSTHLSDSAAVNVRVIIGYPALITKASPYDKLFTPNATGLPGDRYTRDTYEINWLDVFYHSSDRFLVDNPWSYASAQQEQDSLELFIFSKSKLVLDLASAVTSLIGFPFVSLLRDAVCEHPIPGATVGVFCNIEQSTFKQGYDKFVSYLAGLLGALAGFAILGPGGVVLGSVVTYEGTRGNFMPIIDELIPGYSQMVDGNKKVLQAIIDAIKKRKGDTLQEIVTDTVAKFDYHELDFDDPQVLKNIQSTI